MSQTSRNKKISPEMMMDFQYFLSKELHRVNEDIADYKITSYVDIEDYFETKTFCEQNLLQFKKAFLLNLKEKINGLNHEWDLLDELKVILHRELCKKHDARNYMLINSMSPQYKAPLMIRDCHDWAYYFLVEFTKMVETSFNKK